MKIEKNVPIPKEESRGRPSKYPVAEMEIGDSIFVKGEGTTGNAYRAITAYGRKQGWKMLGRNVEGGIRIWRVE